MTDNECNYKIWDIVNLVFLSDSGLPAIKTIICWLLWKLLRNTSNTCFINENFCQQAEITDYLLSNIVVI